MESSVRVFLQIVTLGVASNLDNLAVGVAYGIRRISISTPANLAIAGIAFLFTVASVLAATQVRHVLSPRSADLLGSLILIGIGIWMLPVRKSRPPEAPPATGRRPTLMNILRGPELADRDHSNVISLSESLLLGFALSLNCLTNSFSAGLWNLRVMPVAVCNATLSFVTLWCGTWLGNRYGAHWLGRKADAIAGVLLLLMGLHQALWK